MRGSATKHMVQAPMRIQYSYAISLTTPLMKDDSCVIEPLVDSVVSKQCRYAHFSRPKSFWTNHVLCFMYDPPISGIIVCWCFTLLGMVLDWGLAWWARCGTQLEADVCAIPQRCAILILGRRLLAGDFSLPKVPLKPLVYSHFFQPLLFRAQSF